MKAARMEAGAGKGRSIFFFAELGRPGVTNGLRAPRASPASRRCRWPLRWACDQAVTLPRRRKPPASYPPDLFFSHITEELSFYFPHASIHVFTLLLSD